MGKHRDIIPVAVINERGELVRDEPLTPQENAVVEMLTIKGNDYLDTLGWNKEQKEAFLNRPNVLHAIDRQRRLMDDGERVFAAQAFHARLRLGDMLPRALQILQADLLGNDPKNPKKRITPEQREAARQVLSRVGINGEKGTINVSLLGATPVDQTTKYDSRYDRVATMQRNNVRQVIDAIVRVANNTDKQLELLEEARAFRRKQKHKGAALIKQKKKKNKQ